MRLIVVDDNASNRLVAKLILERLGHVIELAEGGRELIDRLKVDTFDLVLCDCQMPGMDGYEATRRIRAGEAGERNRGLPIIALTAYALTDDRRRCLAAGMDDYLSKPLQLCAAEAVLLRFSAEGKQGVRANVPRGDRSLVFDLSILEATAPATIPGLREKLVAGFDRDIPEQFAQLRAAIGARKSRASLRYAQSIASACAIMGGRQAKQAAILLEGAVAREDWTRVAELADDLNARLSELRQELEARAT